MELTDKEKEIHEIVRTILKDSKNPGLETAIKYCKLALRSNGNELREACQYLLGNAIKWAGPNHQEMKLALRKFAFRQPPTYSWRNKHLKEDDND